MSSFFKGWGKTYNDVENTKNVYDTASNKTEAVSMWGQAFDYVSKFAIGRKVPMLTPPVIADPIEEKRKDVVSYVDQMFTPTPYKQQRESVAESNNMLQFQQQKIDDFTSMPEWQKKEMGDQYHMNLNSMQDELLLRQNKVYDQQHQLDLMGMNWGRKLK